MFEDFDHLKSVLKLHCQSYSCVMWKLFKNKRHNFPLVYGFCEYNKDMKCIGSTVHMVWSAMYKDSLVNLIKNFFVRNIVTFGNIISLVDFINIWDQKTVHSLSSKWISF